LRYGSGISIGIDLDNTIISYDDILYKLAVERKLIPNEIIRNKRIIRDTIRSLPGGEVEWRKLQALAYGPMLCQGMLIDGVPDFVELCRKQGVKTFIVSHKTEYAEDKFDTGINLREAALEWMTARDFFSQDGLGFERSDIFFESTRKEKINRIKLIGCRCFIDDLEETFMELLFPEGIEKILYDPQLEASAAQGMKIFRTWNDIRMYLFNN